MIKRAIFCFNRLLSLATAVPLWPIGGKRLNSGTIVSFWYELFQHYGGAGEFLNVQVQWEIICFFIPNNFYQYYMTINVFSKLTSWELYYHSFWIDICFFWCFYNVQHILLHEFILIDKSMLVYCLFDLIVVSLRIKLGLEKWNISVSVIVWCIFKVLH